MADEVDDVELAGGGVGSDPPTTREARLLRLFAGFDGAHGTHGPIRRKVGGVKQDIKGSAKTVREPVTEALWADHLAGNRALGVIPIRADSTCFWGVIDVDRYDVNHKDLYQQLEERKLPLVVAKSKSGGAHLFIFLAEPQPAIEVRSLLGAISASLGLGGSEIFPKQTELLLDSGDIGNWLNMPYLGGDATDRYAVGRNGGALTLDQFLSLAEKNRLTSRVFDQLQSVGPAERARAGSSRPRGTRRPSDGGADSNAEPLADGPPCLEHLASAGFGSGMRNNGLFAIGVYCKKRYGSHWSEKLEEFNHAFMRPPLASEEVLAIKRSLEKQDYQYSCKQEPLCSHCNQTLCRTRRHGISSSGDYPVVSSLAVLNTDPPLWFLDVEDERLEVSTDQLQNYRLFQKVVMERLHKFYKPIKQDTWQGMIAQAIVTLVVIEAPEEVGVHGHFRELLTEFLTNRQRGRVVEDLFSGRPWEDETTGRHYFRLKDLEAYLKREGMPDMTRGQMTTRIKTLGGDSKFKNIKKQGVNTWWVPSSVVSRPLVPDVPEVTKEPM